VNWGFRFVRRPANVRAAFLLLGLLALAGCGGGGGGGNNGVSINTSAISLTAPINGPLPAAHSYSITWSNTNVAAVLIGVPTSESIPTWIDLSAPGNSSPLTLNVGVNTTNMAVGTYKMTMRVVGVDKNGGVINYVDVPVTYTITNTLSSPTSVLNFSYIFGSDAQPASQIVSINGENLQWTATTSQSWLQLDKTSGTTPTNLTISIDTSTISIGTNTAQITLTNQNNAKDTFVLNVTLQVYSPIITVSGTTVVVGGTNGHDFTPQPFNFRINTGSMAYPWTMTLNSGTGLSWLKASASSGTVSSTNTSLSFDADRSGLTAGTYFGSATITVDVKGQMISKMILVNLVVDDHMVYVHDTGAAFVSTPSMSVLSKTVTVQDSNNLSTTPWAASSDQTWLTVTSSGNTGGSLTMTADPTGLATDTIHYANVTITSTDSTVINTETIHVGFWAGSADPNAQDSLTATYTEIVADPIRPYVYMNNGGTDIDVYNVYTASKVTTISNVATTLGNMTVSTDGSTLYAVDLANLTIVPVDLGTQSVGSAWTTTAASVFRIAYARPITHGVVLSSAGRAYDVDTGTAYSNTFSIGKNLAANLDGNKFCGVNEGFSPYTLTCQRLDYVHISGQLMTGLVGSNTPAGLEIAVGSNGKDVALSHDGTIAYVASGAPYGLLMYNTENMTQLLYVATGAYPIAVEVGPDNRILTASSVWYGPLDVWVFDPSYTPLGNYYLSGNAKSIRDRQLAVSGDGRRIIVSTDDPSVQIVTAP